MKYVIVNVPHASTTIPSSFNSTMDLGAEVGLCTDWFTDELIVGDQSVIFPFSRLWCDPERLENDPLESCGRGFYTTHTLDGQRFRDEDKASPDWLDSRDMYKRHHFLLADAITKANSYTDVVLLDAHSYCDRQVLGAADAPDICLGYVGAAPSFIRPLKTLFESRGFSVGLNVPFSGAIVSDERSESVMFEVNKKLYLTDDLGKSDGWDTIKTAIDEAVDLLRNS